VATEQSERIRAALLRAKASRQPNNSSSVESAEEPETASAETEFSETSESAEAEAESISAEPSIEEESEAENEDETPLLEPEEEVESTLPLVAASEKERAFIFDEKIVPKNRGWLAPEPASDEDTTRPRIDAGGTQAGSRSSRIFMVVGGVIVLAGLSVFFLRDRIWPGSKSNTTGASFPLQMQVESQGNGIINVRWNPQSAAVSQAREGRLVIIERDQQTRTIALNTEQLKIGHLYYQSPVERVEFRLEVVDQAGGIAKESVLALSSGAVAAEPAAGPPIAPVPVPPSTESAKIQKAAPAETHSEPPRAPKAAEVPRATETARAPQIPAQPSRQPVRSFAPPPSQQKSEETRAMLLDAPPVVGGGPLAPSPVNLPEAAVRLPAPQVKEPAAPKQMKTGGNLRAPLLVKRVTPVYPPAAKAANIQGKVRFTATIGKDGTIQNVEVVNGPAILVPAATEAVKKWVYQPMLLNGEATEVVTQIEVNFELHQ